MREYNSRSDRIVLCSFLEAEIKWNAIDADGGHSGFGCR